MAQWSISYTDVFGKKKVESFESQGEAQARYEALIPRTYGGKQEGGLRPGTEAAPLIAAFGAAVAEIPHSYCGRPRFNSWSGN